MSKSIVKNNRITAHDSARCRHVSLHTCALDAVGQIRKQDWAGQGRAEQGRAGQGRAGQGRAGHRLCFYS